MAWQKLSANGIFAEGEFPTLDEAIEAVEKERKQQVCLAFKASGLYAEAIGKKSGKLVEVALFRNVEAKMVRDIPGEIEYATRDRSKRDHVEESFGQECDRMSRVAGW
jgi:hypothetical protein